ncbi:peptide chain release factor 1-like, mitochondrial isoform X1 [Vespa mandarinia]|uniref:peptide chain release factor 1-like, mitochondrial isoform X1 n=1 Tax=Vespa mandarinia TaxID=7446 RepID=UPI001616D685|nr:peptide chain release factor 1-like, mitochondrial isoform X1 [Vespa mandarinia]
MIYVFWIRFFLTTKTIMFLLILSRRFNVHRRPIMIYDTSQRCNSLINLNTLHNLKGLFRFMSNNVFASRLNLPLSDNSVKKYLDYLSDTYQSNQWKENNFVKMIDIKSVAVTLEDRINIKENVKYLKDLGKEDEEMKRLAQEEEVIYKKQLDDLDEKLLNIILYDLDKENYNNIILEISAGVGGQEAMLFVEDLYKMYLGYADYLGIEHELLELDKSENGIRHTSILLKGNLAFKKFRYEGGVHRVQRIPKTEKSGRMHTSTVSVAILPEPTDIETNLNHKDLKIETMRSSGAGGQHVNTTDSAVRITHCPTGITVCCETQRSQIKNKEIALLKLKTILYQQELNKQIGIVSEMRKKQMGLKFRNEKIRTYNYNQDRITDHRLENGTMHNLKLFMTGGEELEKLEGILHSNIQMKILVEMINKLESKTN